MNLSIMYIIGIVAGLLLVAVAFSIIAYVARKNCSPVEYDERQQIARSNAFKLAFISLALYLLLVSILDAIGVRFGSLTAISALGICISVTLFACSCILHDAYLSVREKPKTLVIIFAILIVANGGSGILRLCSGEIVQDGMLTLYSTNLMCAAMAIIILVVLLIKLHFSRRSAVEDET